jgi:glycosyltransferase involved in cell wall biosynthesis
MTGANRVYIEAAHKLAPPDVKVEWFPYPIQNSFFAPHDGDYYRKLFNLEPNDLLLTLPSRIIERKGIREAVEALSLLPGNCYLCLPAAVTPLDKAYWQSIVDSKVFRDNRQRILIPKQHILHDRMPELYAATQIVVMPSYYEGAPVATVEAMASAVPFVGANSQGINDFIQHDINGLLVPQKSAEELARAVQRLISDESLRTRLIKQARKDVWHLSWEEQLPHLVEMYERARSYI